MLVFEAQSGRSARAVRSLALPIVNELSPALGQTTQQITNVIASAALLARRPGSHGGFDRPVSLIVSYWT